MSNKVVTTLARAFARLGADAVRFNFRGVGDVAKAATRMAWASARMRSPSSRGAARRWPDRRLYLGGFSFGAAVAAAIAARVAPAGLVTVAPPVDKLPADFVAPTCPWLLVHGEADDVVPRGSRASSGAQRSPAPPRIVLLPGVGHFFHGRLPALAQAVTDAFGADFGAVRSG